MIKYLTKYHKIIYREQLIKDRMDEKQEKMKLESKLKVRLIYDIMFYERDQFDQFIL